jgi:cob(I)alamin adenosyltransferase
VLVDIIAAIKAMATIALTLKEISERLADLKQEAIQKELKKLQVDLHKTLDTIAKAETKEERRRLSAELAGRLIK